ncbi:hypothetical protein BDB00DRAFT_824435 [Zychaea mexicana]|uniref:uncharacterized protein n=1 Tax=Zychaea mexicana TaxID=64656 RepID=UPI0022FE925E|nr:uncharacterized protein BDB00DRAFT_824435 [Zychaea mexicana]KAI9493109.1 hypothetical protein BDB00DRAFT_824435 [Zychaea mexicana]
MQDRDTNSTLTTSEATLRFLQDPERLRQIVQKQRKLARKKQGRKRRDENAEQRRVQLELRREKLHADIDRWQRETRQQEQQRQQQSRQQESRLISPQKSKIRKLSKLVENLTQLRNIRRKRLQVKGHFFPEDGNKFFERIKILNDEQSSQELPEEEDRPEEKALYVHPDDSWTKSDLDSRVYKYWGQAYQTTNDLRRIRNQWDYFLYEGSSSSIESKVPPTWVPPAPPSNWIWATYLVDQSQ